LEAAAAKNATLFLIPEGQSTVTITRTSSGSRGALIITQSKEESVDVVELGKKLNVTVKEVRTIQDVILEFTGQKITEPTYEGTILTTGYMDLLKPLAENLKMNPGTCMGKWFQRCQKQVLVNAKEILDNADKMYNDQKFYAATSLYFNSMYMMRSGEWSDGYEKSSNKEQYLAGLANIVQRQIQRSENDLDNFTAYGISDAEAVGAAESRITAARSKLDDANQRTIRRKK